MLTQCELIKICNTFAPPQSIVMTKRLVNGLSNDNFLIRTKQQGYLLKCYKKHWPTTGLDAQYFLSQFKICPAPIWYDKASKRAAFDFIEGNTAQTYSQIMSPNFINKLAQVHAYDVKTSQMDLAQELSFYHRSPIYRQHKLYIDKALKAIYSMPYDEGFCHNDLVKENIVVNTLDVYLIDFEYAKTNDVYFDLASIAVSFNLSEQNERELLAGYQKGVGVQSKFVQSISKLRHYKLLVLVLCIGWYEQRAIKNKSLELRAQLYEMINLSQA